MKSKTICYLSKDSFPSISVTGENCFFSCSHCNRKYLKSMMSINQEELFQKAVELENRGAIGLLISGGFNQNGKVPIDYSILKKIKDNTDLIINLHSGFVNKEDAKQIKEIGIDAVSVDFVGSNDTINNILKIPFTVNDYEISLKYLIEEGVNTIPHICIGLDQGRIVGEYKAIEIIKKYNIKSLTLLVLIKNEMQKTKSIQYDINSIKDFIRYARDTLPSLKLSLGCMRPRIKELEDIALIFDNIVNPNSNMIKLIRKEYEIIVKEICCSLC